MDPAAAAAARKAINSSSAFDSDESDYDEAEDSLAIKRRGSKVASVAAGPSRSSSGSAGESSSTARKASRRYEEMEVPNWCSVCDRLIVAEGEGSSAPAGIAGGNRSPQLGNGVDEDFGQDALVFGRQATIKQKKRRDVDEVDPGMPVVAAGHVKPVFSRKIKRTASNGVHGPTRNGTVLKRNATSSKLHHSSRNLVAVALAAVEAQPAPAPTYNTELYCSEACARQDEALVAQQLSGLQSLYLSSEEEERQRRESSLAARRYSEWSEVSSTGRVLPPSPLFIGGSDTDSTSATSIAASEGKMQVPGVTSPLDLEDDFDYFRMQTEGMEHGLMERSRRRSMQSARSSSGGQSAFPKMQRTMSNTVSGSLAPVRSNGSGQSRTFLSSSDSLSSMWSEGRSDDGWRAGSSLKPMTPLKATFALPASDSMRPPLAGGRSLSHGKAAGGIIGASPAAPSAEFGSAPAAAHLYQNYPLALPRTGSTRDMTLLRGQPTRSYSHQPLPEAPRRESESLSTSWKMNWERVRSGPVTIDGEQKLSPVARQGADEATTPTQSLVQVMTSRSSASVSSAQLERTVSRDSAASTTTSRSSEVILEEDERVGASPMPVTRRRRLSPPRNSVRLDSPTVAITIGDDVYSTASPPRAPFCHSLPRRMSRRASLLASEPLAAPPAPETNKPQWQHEVAQGKLYQLPVRASTAAETGRLFTFHH